MADRQPDQQEGQDQPDEVMARLQSLADDVAASNALIAAQRAELEELRKEKEGNKENSALNKLADIIANKEKDKANVKAAAPDIEIEEAGDGGVDAGLRDPIITAYDGALAIPGDLVRLCRRAGILPPLSLLSPDAISHARATSRNIFPLSTTSSMEKEARKHFEVYFAIDHWLPFAVMLVSLVNFAYLLVDARISNQDAKATVLGDFYTFIVGLVARNVNEGSYPVLLEYVILKIEEVRAQIEGNAKWSQRWLLWDDKLFKQASVLWGPNADVLATQFASTVGSANVKTAWASIWEHFVPLKDGAAKAATAQAELRAIQQEVLNGRELAGRLPSSVGRRPGVSGSASSTATGPQGGQAPKVATPAGARGTTGWSGSAGNLPTTGPIRHELQLQGGYNPYARPPPPPPPAPNVLPPAGEQPRPFRAPAHCVGCGADGHISNVCPTTSLDRTVRGTLVLREPDTRGRRSICRDFNLGICSKSNENCGAAHSCGRCGKPNAPVKFCTH
ncbi:hypothetical protein JCM1841_002675 [Sporobolomyces salmonicolor]